VTNRRSRVHSYLLLARISNLPTVWTNVLAGFALAHTVPEWPGYLRVALSLSCSYTAGMFLNDAFDRHVDRQERPGRPIPAGDVAVGEVFGAGALFLLAGALLLAFSPVALGWGLALAVAIVFYDFNHKGSAFGPFVMGLCRGLVYCVAAASSTGVTLVVLAGAAVLAIYVSGLTQVAKLAGARARWLVPALIAGIALLDALIIAVTVSLPLALVSAIGFPLTLFLQRFVPGD